VAYRHFEVKIARAAAADESPIINGACVDEPRKTWRSGYGILPAPRAIVPSLTTSACRACPRCRFCAIS